MVNLIIKDIKNIVYDRKTCVVLIVMPIVLMSILGNALRGTFSSSSGISDINIAIVKAYDYNLEKDRAIKKMESMIGEPVDFEALDPEEIFFEDFLGGEGLEFIKYTIVSRERALEMIDADDISAIIVLPERFIYNSIASMTFATRNKMEIEVIKNTDKSFTAGIIEEIVKGYIDIINDMVTMKNVAFSLSSRAKMTNLDISEFMTKDSDSYQNIEIIIKDISQRDPINSFQYYAAAIMTMFLLYAAAEGGKALLEEKRNFTAQRLDVTGIGVTKAALSNMIRIMCITYLQTIIAIFYSSVVLKVNWGDPLTVIIAMLLTGFAIGGIGMFVSVVTYVADKAAVSIVFEMVILQFMALIGGSFIPIQILPKAIQKLQIFSANGSALKIYLNAMYHKPLSDSYIYMLALISVGTLFSTVAYGILRLSRGRVSA